MQGRCMDSRRAPEKVSHNARISAEGAPVISEDLILWQDKENAEFISLEQCLPCHGVVC